MNSTCITRTMDQTTPYDIVKHIASFDTANIYPLACSCWSLNNQLEDMIDQHIIIGAHGYPTYRGLIHTVSRKHECKIACRDITISWQIGRVIRRARPRFWDEKCFMPWRVGKLIINSDKPTLISDSGIELYGHCVDLNLYDERAKREGACSQGVYLYWERAPADTPIVKIPGLQTFTKQQCICISKDTAYASQLRYPDTSLCYIGGVSLAICCTLCGVMLIKK